MCINYKSSIQYDWMTNRFLLLLFILISLNITYILYVISALNKWKYLEGGSDIGQIVLQKETFYIYILNTLSPKGLSLEFYLKPFL